MDRAGSRRSFILPFILVLIILFPIILTLMWSLTVRWRFPELIPPAPSLYGWKNFIFSRDFALLGDSLQLSTEVSLATLLIAVPAARALSTEFPGKRAVELITFLPVIIPVTALSMGIQVFFIRNGLAYSRAGVILMQVFPCLPYAVRIMQSVFTILGEDYEHTARNLGAGGVRTFFDITLPLMFPALISAFSMIFIVSFSQYFITFMVGGGRVETFATRMFPYLMNANRTVASVYATVFTLVCLMFLGISESILGRLYGKRNREVYYI